MWVTALTGAAIGGFAAGLLWTAQGAFFGQVCEKIAAAEGRHRAIITGELSSSFAWIYLAWECVARATTTIMKPYVSVPNIFLIFAGLALVSTVILEVHGKDLPAVMQRRGCCSKVTTVISLWRDPKLWLLQATNITFGFATGWLNGYVASHILGKTVHVAYIGFAGAVLSGVAAILAKFFGCLAICIGKGPIIFIGSVAFFLIGVLSLGHAGDPKTWGWGTISFYALMGIGRAVYESVNRGVIADVFPGPLSLPAFANTFVFGTLASTVAYILGGVGHTMPEVYCLLLFSVITFPCFAIAVRMAKSSNERLSNDW